MTTFQDPQPQSRRAVRQSERDTSELKPPFSTTGPLPTPPQSYTAPAEAGDMWDTTQRRAAQISPAPSRPDAAAPTSGRRSSQAAAAQAAAAATPEPLLYSTQGRPTETPSSAPTFRPRGGAAAAPSEPGAAQNFEQQGYSQQSYEQPPTQAMPQTEQPAYRLRDFSPEGRRSAAAPAPTPAAPPQAPYSAPEAEWTHTSPPSDLDYQTQGRLPYEVPVAPVAAAPVQAAPAVAQPVHELPVEQTLSRRELRALKLAEQAETPPAPAYEPAAFAAAPPQPDLNTGLTSAITEFDDLTREPTYVQPAVPQPVQQQPAAHDPAAPAYEPAPRTPPAGHWSVQAEVNDHDLFETTLSRTVGTGAATTSALVLPVTPGGTDIRGPLTGTGEIILTGSINLPHSLSSTGASARFDHGGIDTLFDAGDAEVISTDSAPVSAIKAVSTHNSGFAVTHTQKPKGTRALTILLIAASSMAVIVAGLLITAFALNVF